MSITTGSPLPNVTTTQTTSQDAPAYYDQLLSGLSSAGQTALAKTPNQLVAGLDPLQQQAYGMTADKAASYVPGMTGATTAASTAAQGITPEMIQGFMNPYTQNVNEELRRQADVNWTRNVMPALRGQFVSTGGAGGRRYAGALGQTLAETQADLLGAQNKNLNLGYQSALDAAAKNVDLINKGAITQADIASQMQGLGLKETGALQAAGANQQAYQQSLLDAPLKTAANVAPLLEKYKVPTTSTETYVGPKPGLYGSYYSNSPLANLMSLGTFIGSATTGTAADKLASAGKSLYSVYKNLTGSTPQGPIDIGGGLQLGSDGTLKGYNADGSVMTEDQMLNALNGGDALSDVYGPNGGLPDTSTDITSQVPADYVAPNVEE